MALSVIFVIHKLLLVFKSEPFEINFHYSSKQLTFLLMKSSAIFIYYVNTMKYQIQTRKLPLKSTLLLLFFKLNFKAVSFPAFELGCMTSYLTTKPKYI